VATGKLIITRGLPASGKSTWAEDLRRLAPNAVRVVTMDDIRSASGAVFEAGDEPLVQVIRDTAIRQYLAKGYTVISADTNLHQYTFTRVRQLGRDAGVEVIVQDFTGVSLHTCLRRNQDRWLAGDHKVPDQAIIDMHEKYIRRNDV
jgi:predicted kinase